MPSFKLTVLLVAIVISGGAPSASDLPDYDAVAHLEPGETGRLMMQLAAGDHRVHRFHVEPRLGAPTFLWTARGTDGRVGLHSPTVLGSEEAARRHLEDQARFYGVSRSEVRSAPVGSIHDTGRGAIIVAFRQDVGGIEIFRDEVKVAMARDGSLIALAGSIGPARARGAGRAYRLRAPEAIAAALEDFGGDFSPSDLKPAGRAEGGFETYEFSPRIRQDRGLTMAQPARVKPVLFRLAAELVPAWYLEVDLGRTGSTDADHYAYVLSALDGSLLYRKNLTVSDSFAYRVWADPAGFNIPFDGPQGSAATPHPTGLPDGFQAPFVAPSLITLQNGPISTNDPWLPPSSTATVGNNADAYADVFSPDGLSAGDFRATTTGPGAFDRTYDTSQGPQVSQFQQMASVTQLFYTVNFLHDWFYDSGFDEPSRNAQTNNFGRGGLGGDSMRAEAQDYSGRNNANMSTPSDGGRPRMQMYVFDGIGSSKVTVNSPPAIAGEYVSGTAAFGPTTFNSTQNVILVNDGAGVTTDGCESPFVNSALVNGRIALIDRGTCNFTVKVKNAQNNGAIGVIIANNTSGVINMGGTDGTITIPSLMISLADGNTIKGQLGTGVNATLVRLPVVDRDGTLDNQIVAHEWGHYVSNRLVGNAVGLTATMARGLGEGWGDFHALLMSVRSEDTLVSGNDNWQGVLSLAGYVASGGTNNGYYFGIRRAPYSTDFSKNPLTFRHIENGVPLPTTAPIAFGQTGTNNAEVHNSGEIWTNMLWECYAALLRDTLGGSPRLTFDQAQQRMRDYLIAAYKLTPNDPTLLEARDALLAAAFAADRTDFELFAQAFARRGAGLGAVAPDRFDPNNAGVVESFITGGELTFDGASLVDSVSTRCFPDGALDDQETGLLTITLSNTGIFTLTGTTGSVTSSTPGVSFPGGNSLAFGSSDPFGATQASVQVSLAGVTGIQQIDFDVTFDDPLLVVPGPRNVTVTRRANFDDAPAQSATDDVESSNPVTTPSANPALDTSLPWRRVAVTAVNHRWLGPDTGATSDHYLITPSLNVSPTGTFGFTFRHRHSFEFDPSFFYDGGVIELSAGGGPWVDIGGSAIPGYGGAIALGGANPIEGRSAYVAQNSGYPGLNTVFVDLGTAYQGQTVRVRFRIGTDVFVGAPGWEIDDIAFTGITNTPFPALVPHDGTCDADTDGTFDASDCAPSDPSLWSAPSEALDLTVAGTSPSILNWTGPALPGGAAAPVFDLLRANAGNGFAAAACLASGVSATSGNDAATPGFISYYLVRSRNACGGTLGVDSAGGARSGVICP